MFITNYVLLFYILFIFHFITVLNVTCIIKHLFYASSIDDVNVYRISSDLCENCILIGTFVKARQN